MKPGTFLRKTCKEIAIFSMILTSSLISSGSNPFSFNSLLNSMYSARLSFTEFDLVSSPVNKKHVETLKYRLADITVSTDGFVLLFSMSLNVP